ncbi:MAG: AI-2E family transporter [Microbacteriaceae bacterium]
MVFRSRDAREREAADKAVADSLPVGMRIAGAWSWRLLVIAGVVAVLIFLIIQLRLIVIPLLVAIVLSALLVPFCNWLQKHRWPKALAVAVTEVGVLAIIAGLVTLVIQQIRGGFGPLRDATTERYFELKQLLLESPLHLTDTDINKFVTDLVAALRDDSDALVSGALSVGATTGHVLAGVLLALFATLFILIDGHRIFLWIARLFPRRARPAVVGAGEAGWVTLTTFVKVQIFVAFVDAVGIGVGAWILGLFYGGFPLVIPIAVAVFLGSFIPIIGAVATGALAVFVALVYFGPVPALIMLGIVILVQQVEGHVLQPLVMGTAVKIHPLAVVVAVASGGFIAGIPGAFFAVPTVAVLNVVVGYIARAEWRTTPHPTPQDVIHDGR